MSKNGIINLLFNFILYELLYVCLGFEQTLILMGVNIIVWLIRIYRKGSKYDKC